MPSVDQQLSSPQEFWAIAAWLWPLNSWPWKRHQCRVNFVMSFVKISAIIQEIKRCIVGGGKKVTTEHSCSTLILLSNRQSQSQMSTGRINSVAFCQYPFILFSHRIRHILLVSQQFILKCVNEASCVTVVSHISKYCILLYIKIPLCFFSHNTALVVS